MMRQRAGRWAWQGGETRAHRHRTPARAPRAGPQPKWCEAISPAPREEIDVEDGLLTILHGDGLGLREVALRGDGNAVGAGLQLQREGALEVRALAQVRRGDGEDRADGTALLRAADLSGDGGIAQALGGQERDGHLRLLAGHDHRGLLHRLELRRGDLYQHRARREVVHADLA